MEVEKDEKQEKGDKDGDAEEDGKGKEEKDKKEGGDEKADKEKDDKEDDKDDVKGEAKDKEKDKGNDKEKEKDKDKDKDRKRDRSDSDSEADRRKKRDTRPETRKRPDPRSRNMFGKLLGHLQKAKTNLDNERGSKFFDLNTKAKTKAESKIALDKVNIQDLRMRQFENQQKEEEAKVQMMEKQIEEKELLLLQLRLEKHYGLMMNFIRTKAEPTIFYLPAKHTKETESMLEETRDAIKHKITSLKVQLQPIQDESGQVEGAPDAVATADGDKTKSTEGVDQDSASKEEAKCDTDEKSGKMEKGEKSAHDASEEESVPRGAPATQAEADAKEGDDKDPKECDNEKEKDHDEDKSKDKDDKKDEEAPPKKKTKKGEEEPGRRC